VLSPREYPFPGQNGNGGSARPIVQILPWLILQEVDGLLESTANQLPVEESSNLVGRVSFPGRNIFASCGEIVNFLTIWGILTRFVSKFARIYRQALAIELLS
jgi:hypothetical protein